MCETHSDAYHEPYFLTSLRVKCTYDLLFWFTSRLHNHKSYEDSLLTHWKTLEIIVSAYWIENRFNYIRRLLFSIPVKILKQWTLFDPVIPYIEIYPRKKKSEVVMKKICIVFLKQNTVTYLYWLSEDFPLFSDNSFTAGQVLTNFLVATLQQNPPFCWLSILRSCLKKEEIQSSNCLLRH